MAEFRLATARVILREWRETDVTGLLELGSDKRVMEFLGPPQSEDDVRAMLDRQRKIQEQFSYCFWAIELRSTRQMIGFCGIQPGPIGTPIENYPEIGWRLAFDHWGRAYAKEAAQTVLNWYWDHVQVQQIWAITVPTNTRSTGLMKRLGMRRHQDMDFEHPRVPDDSPLKRHITYSLSRDAWIRA